MIFAHLALREKDYFMRRRLRKSGEVVYGARSLNRQVSPFFRRETFDWDVYSGRPRKSARGFKRVLNREARGKSFYVKPALHKGTHKVMFVGGDGVRGTRDDVGVADYTKRPKGLRVVRRGGINYSHLSHEVSNRKKSLRDRNFSFRHGKDRDDLRLVRGSRNWMKI